VDLQLPRAAVRRDQIDTALLETVIQSIPLISAITIDMLELGLQHNVPIRTVRSCCIRTDRPAVRDTAALPTSSIFVTLQYHRTIISICVRPGVGR
jgi:hypothetical protein